MQAAFALPLSTLAGGSHVDQTCMVLHVQHFQAEASVKGVSKAMLCMCTTYILCTVFSGLSVCVHAECDVVELLKFWAYSVFEHG